MATTEIPITDRRRVRNVQEVQREGSEANVGRTERWLSAIAGGALMASACALILSTSVRELAYRESGP